MNEAQALAAELGRRTAASRWPPGISPTACGWCGEPDRALELAHRTAEVAQTLGDVTLEVLGNFYLGEAYNALGEYAQSVRCLARNGELAKGERALERFAGPGLVPLQSRFWLAMSLVELGHFDEAVAIAEEAHAAAEAMTIRIASPSPRSRSAGSTSRAAPSTPPFRSWSRRSD